MTKTVLVTGISGFIAKHVALEFLKAGYKVRGTVRSKAKGDKVAATLAKHTDVKNLEFVEADLMSDAGWDDAVNGCDCVAHVASPFPLVQPKDENELIKPAVEGTLRVLRAAKKAGVKRFVQTSSSVAVMYGHGHNKLNFNEDDWSDVNGPGITAYGKSKTLAERAARDFIAAEGGNMHFATINPTFVFGPALDGDIGTSVDIIRMFLAGRYPGAPRIHIPCVDVRDVARMHVLAIETSQPSGGRYIASAQSVWLIDIARTLREKLGKNGRRAPRFVLPDFVVKLIAIFDVGARAAVPELGLQRNIDNSRTRKALGIEFIPVDEAVTASGRSLIEYGLV